MFIYEKAPLHPIDLKSGISNVINILLSYVRMNGGEELTTLAQKAYGN